MDEDDAAARELDALRREAGVSVLDDRAILAARGSDRASFLQGMLSNEVARLAAGAGVPALLLNEQGKIVAALRVYVLSDEIWLDVSRARRDAARAALERFIVADDVELEDRPAVAVAVRGPGAAAVVARAAGLDAAGGEQLAASPEGAIFELVLGGATLRATRARDLGTDGLHLWAPSRAEAERAAQACVAAGGVAVGDRALEALRVARGVAREGADFGSQTLAAEVPMLAGAISFKKGCYLGQEVVERIAARGHVNWLVVALSAEGREAPPVGAAVWAAEGEVGQVTSAVRLPASEAIAMLARVRRTSAAPGTALEIDGRAGRLAARVVEPAPADG